MYLRTHFVVSGPVLTIVLTTESLIFFQRRVDPKDRIKADAPGDIGGLVLSPQRRSFLTGCQLNTDGDEGQQQQQEKQQDKTGEDFDHCVSQ